MKIEINCIKSVEDILRSYSGRRLQYAIRMGILPAPENFSLLLIRNTNVENKILNALPKTKVILAAQVTRNTFNKVNIIEHNANMSQAM